MDVVIALVVAILVGSWLLIVLVGPPYVPTLQRDLTALFDVLKVGARDHVVDLGSGDGRILEVAVKRGARATGVELNPFLVAFSWLRLRRYGARARVRYGDMWRLPLPADTTYVFIFPAKLFVRRLTAYMADNTPKERDVQLVVYGFQLPHKRPERTIGAFNLYTF